MINLLKVSSAEAPTSPLCSRHQSPQRDAPTLPARQEGSVFLDPAPQIGNILAAELDRLHPVMGTRCRLYPSADAEQRCKERSKNIKAISIKEQAPGGINSGGGLGGCCSLEFGLKYAEA